MSMSGVNGALAGAYQFAASKAADKTEGSDINFIDQLKKTGEAAGLSRVDDYLQHLKSKYGNVSIQSVGKDQESLDRIGKSMSGSDVVIAPNILEQMANEPKKAFYYEQKIDYYFNTIIPRETALCAGRGLVFEPGGVVVHEDGTVTYISGCSDSPERVAEVNAINKAKREKAAAQRKANLERSRKMAEERKRQIDMAYRQKSMAEFFANHVGDTSRVNYTAAQEVMGSVFAAYEKEYYGRGMQFGVKWYVRPPDNN